VERQLSPITLLNYRRQLETLIALADSAGLKSWQQCDAAQVRSLAVRSRRQGWGQPAWLYVSPPYAASLTGW
jgi:integrase/recombinase XerC